MRPVCRRLALTAVLLALLASSLAVAGDEGEWIDLATLKEAEVHTDAEVPPAPASVPVEPLAAEAPSTTAGAAPPAEDPPPLELPRRFHWQGELRELGRAGYVYLGDYYAVEERDYAKAETCFTYALRAWPQCGPIQTRMDLLSLFTGDWLRAAESMQVGFDQGAPPRVTQDYGIDASSPLLSAREADVPAVPAILFRNALAQARQLAVTPDQAAPRDFLVGRLLAFLGDQEEAIRVLGPVALDEDGTAAPWNFQAASQRAALYLESWQPELAYVNLLQARDLAGEHPVLMDRIASLEAEMALQAAPGPGAMAQAVVRILGRQGQGRWILSVPDLDFDGRVMVAQVGPTALPEDEILVPQLLYRGREYWLHGRAPGQRGAGLGGRGQRDAGGGEAPGLARALWILHQFQQDAMRVLGVQEADPRPPAPRRAARGRMPRSARSGQGGVQVGHLEGRLLQALAALVEEAGDGAVVAERRKQLEPAVARRRAGSLPRPARARTREPAR